MLPTRCPATTPWPFGAMRPFSYDLLMVDPPWPVKMRSARGETKSAAAKYGLMSIADIAALPIGQLGKRNSVILLWANGPLLLDGGDPDRHYRFADAAHSPAGQVIKTWGYRYVGIGAWFKRTSRGKPAFGTGYRLRSAMEPWLIGIMGNPATSRSARNAFEGLRREHSRKPEEAYAWCESYLPAGARFAELFARASRPGWDSWGHEAGKFDPVVHTGTTETVAGARRAA